MTTLVIDKNGISDNEWLARAKVVMDYNPDTGLFTWLVSFGRVKAGETAGTTGGTYCYIRVNGSTRLAHRAAFAWVHGYWPDCQIDHVNGEKRDNRICNLREASSKQNAANSPRRKDNTSGFKGVRPARTKGKWWAHIYVDGRCRYLGTYDTPEEAHASYLSAAEIEFGSFTRAA